MRSEIEALNELKGRLTFLQIEYLDTGVRIRPAIEVIEHSLNLAVKGPISMDQIDKLGEELSDLKGYLSWLQGEYPIVKKDTQPTINVIDWLLGTEDSGVRH